VFAIEVSVTNHARPTELCQQAGITWYNDGKPVFKEVKKLFDGDLYIILGLVALSARNVRLRLFVSTDPFEAQYCTERATEFQTVWISELLPPGDDCLSIQCCNGPSD